MTEPLPGFDERQAAAHARFRRMVAFYRVHNCRMVRLHLLSSAALVLVRGSGWSPAFAAIGEATCPIGPDGAPRTPAWAHYAEVCAAGRPKDVREDAWIEAHLADIDGVRSSGILDAFAAERAPGDLRYVLVEHVAVTLGSRIADADALAGRIPNETAIAESVRVGLGRLLVGPLPFAYARATLRSLVFGPSEDRRVAAWLVWFAFRAPSAARVVRMGLRRAERGRVARGAGYSLLPSLEQVLGDEVHRVHPQVRALFDDLDRFRFTASVQLHTLWARGFARAAAWLVGQGMYEQDLAEVDARFRLFRRADGSHHFLREFFARDAVRVFDSDFVVGLHDGAPTLYEVFADLGTAARMRTTVGEDGSLSTEVVEVVRGGRRVDPRPFRVCFVSSPADGGAVDVVGVLELHPQSWLERLVFRWLLRRPTALGRIAYRAVPRGPDRE